MNKLFSVGRPAWSGGDITSFISGPYKGTGQKGRSTQGNYRRTRKRQSKSR